MMYVCVYGLYAYLGTYVHCTATIILVRCLDTRQSVRYQHWYFLRFVTFIYPLNQHNTEVSSNIC